MNSSARRRTLLVVVSSLGVGGPQKSLMGLLQRLDTNRFEVSLMVLDPQKDALRDMVPRHVSLLGPDEVVTAATLPRSRFVGAARSVLRYLCGEGRYALAIRFVAIMCWGLASRTPGQRLRQRVWLCVGNALPRVPGKFDLAVGILGLSTYAVVDLVDARYKYHWIRSDTRVLDRDERIEQVYFSRLQGALSVSPMCAEIFMDIYPSMRGRVRVYRNDIPAGPPSEQLIWPSTSSTVLKVLTVTRLVPLKGLDLALATAVELRARGRNVSWLVLGDGPERSELIRQIRAHDLDLDFVLLGNVRETAPYLELADIYVHPSRAEGRSNAVEEARAAGKAIVATNYPTVADQVRAGVDGLVCAMDALALTEAIEKLADDTGLRKRLGSAAQSSYRAQREDSNRLFEQLATGQIRKATDE